MKITREDRNQLEKLMEVKNLSFEDVVLILSNLPGKIEDKINNGESIIINYCKESIEDYILELGLIDYNRSITSEKFPIPLEMKGNTVREVVKKISFDRSVSYEELIRSIEKEKNRYANIFELITYAKTSSKKGDFKIAALGSVYEKSAEDLFVLVLEKKNDTHQIYLERMDQDLEKNVSFLTICSNLVFV